MNDLNVARCAVEKAVLAVDVALRELSAADETAVQADIARGEKARALSKARVAYKMATLELEKAMLGGRIVSGWMEESIK